jgi:hypothetical protein
VFAASGNWENWSALDALGTDAVRTRDTQELSAGGEFDGPQVLGNRISLRIGGRWRDLPFAAGDSWVNETAFGFGVGVPLANIGGLPRASFDLATQRASRSGVAGARETAWTLSVGLTVRP